MKAEEVRICVLRIEGSNCEEETYNAFKTLGADPELVHLNQFTAHAPIDRRRSLTDYEVLALPGGSSAGDYIRAGAIFAARIGHAISADLERFVLEEKPVIGIGNGFQVLMELGLLPAIDGPMPSDPVATLLSNDSGRFECRSTLLRNDNRGNCLFTRKIEKGGVVMFPSAHAEGKFFSMEPGLVERLEDNDQIVFRYVDEDGEQSEYPWNPNGSLDDIAGICNPAGNVMGLMPHPERALSPFTHPNWTRGYDKKEGDGMAVFRSIMEHVQMS